MSDLTLRAILLGEDRSGSAAIKGMGRAADETGGHLTGLGTKAVAVGAAVGTFAANGVTALGRMGLSAVKAGVQTAASMEQADIAFTQLLGSQQQSAAFLTQLKTFAAATPFELPGLIDASRQLVGVGMDAKNVIPTLTAFGDASGALGLSQDNFNHIMMATTQAMSAGKFQAGDMLQITQAGLPVWNILSQALGKPVATLKDMASQGKLLSKDVMPALQAQMEKDYGGAMAKQSQTLTGLWSTMMDTFHQGMASAIIPMEPMLRSAIPGAAAVMGKALSAVGSGAGQFFGGLSGHVKRMQQEDRPKLELFGLGLRGMFQAMRDGDVTSDGFVGQMERIGVALRHVYDVVSGDLREAMPTLRQLGIAILGLASTFLPLLTEAWSAFHEPLTDTIRFVIGVALPAIIGLSHFLQEHGTIVRTVAVMIGTVVLAMKAWRLALLTQVAITRVMTAAQVLFNAVLMANPIGLVVIALLALAAGFIYAYKHSETFRHIVTGALNTVRSVASAVVGWFRSSWPLLLGILTGPFGLALGLIVKHYRDIRAGATAVRDWVAARFNDLIGFFTGMPGRIWRSAAGMFDGIKGAFHSALQWIANAWNSLNFSFNIPKVHIPGTNTDVGGARVDVGIPHIGIPALAFGGNVVRAGRVLVGDDGPEVLDLPAGARVTPLGRAGGGDTYNFYVTQPLATAEQIVRAVLPPLQAAKARGVPVGLG